ncbi:17356_t:CDS:2, partial [Acaulospora colombiana]
GNASGPKDIRPIREKQYQLESIKIIAEYLNEAEYKYIVDERLFQMPTAKEYHAIFKFVFQRLDPGKDITKIEEIVNVLRWIKCVFETSQKSFGIHMHMKSRNLLYKLSGTCKHGQTFLTWEIIDQLEKEAEGEPAPFNPDTAFFSYITKAYNVFLEGEDDYSEMAEELDAAYEQSNAEIVAQTADLQKNVDALEKELNEMCE